MVNARMYARGIWALCGGCAYVYLLRTNTARYDRVISKAKVYVLSPGTARAVDLTYQLPG